MIPITCQLKNLAKRTGSISLNSSATLRSTSFVLNNQFSNPRVNASTFLDSLFQAKNPYEDIYPYPKTIEKSRLDEINSLIEPVSKFMQTENHPDKNDETCQVPKHVTDGLKEMGAYGLQVPEEYNGLALSNTEYAKVVEACGNDLSVCVILGAHQSIGFKGILLYGNDEQKKKYLPKLATGEHVAAFALTEPGAGSDAASVKTKATLSADGKHYLLNGSKIWISNGDEAEIFTVFAKTEVNGKEKVSAFIVERSFGGVTNGPHEKKMGIRSVHSVVVNFDNTKVPVENMLDLPGNGFKVAMNILNSGRFGMGAMMAKVQKDLLVKAIEATKDRVQFGGTLVQFSDVQNKIATIAADQYATEAMAYIVSGNMDKGKGMELEAAMCKIYASEAAWRSCDETLQLHGGMGFMTETGIERIMRDLRIFRIFEGANDILRQFVVLSTFKNIKFSLMTAFSTKFFGHQMVKTHPYSTMSSELDKTIRTVISNSYIYLAKQKKNVIKRQVENRHIADCFINIYAAACVLSRIATHKSEVSIEEMNLAKFAFNMLIARANIASFQFKELLDKPYDDMETICKAAIASNGVFSKSPLE